MAFAKLNAPRPAKPTHGVPTHVTIDQHARVTAIALDGERLDVNLGQLHAIPEGAIPQIGQPLEGVELARCPFTGRTAQ